MKKYILILATIIVGCNDSSNNSNQETIQIQYFDSLSSTSPNSIQDINDPKKLIKLLVY